MDFQKNCQLKRKQESSPNTRMVSDEGPIYGWNGKNFKVKARCSLENCQQE